jgi:hypothetical protein
MVLTTKLQKTLVEDAVKDSLLKRYPTFTRPLLIDFNIHDGTVKITSHLKNGNWCIVISSLRGCTEMYKWLDSFHREFPKFSAMMCGDYEPVEEFNRDIDWTKPISKAA